MPPTPSADALGEEIRVLTENPRDLRALLSAGALSVRLNDPAAALAFFARAEEVAPGDPRILAGRGAALVLLQRPGEALALFGQAEAAGADITPFASARGLAYDLLGAPELAQRDYRTALADSRDDETVRRLALSLGISGDVEQSYQLIEPMLARQDRAAWRIRAFTLAMNGDIAGAEQIASSVLPGNMGLGLTPFFRRLQALSPADRAYAAHFGELSSSPERLADARLAPALPQIATGAAPVQLAQTNSGGSAGTRQRGDRAARGGRQSARARERELREASRRSESRVVQASSSLPLPERAPAAAPAATPSEETAPEPSAVAAPSVTETPSPPAAESSSAASAASAEAAPAESAETVPAPSFDLADTPSSRRTDPARAARADAVLASIVNSITIPASELGVAPLREPEPVPQPEPEAPPPATDPAPARAAPTARRTSAARPADPARAWVQVAGGANEDALPATWRRIVAQAPDLFRGIDGWTAPLNATNRLLAGPFANQREAQAFVNRLSAEGIDSFAWSSEAGQRVTPLPAR